MLKKHRGRKLLAQAAGLLTVALVLCASCGGNSGVLGSNVTGMERETQNRADKPVAVPDASPREGGVPLEVSFWGEDSYDPDGEIVKWEWNFGDDAGGDGAWEDYTDTGGAAKHTYEHPGTQVAHLRVTDNDGNTDTAFVKIKMKQDGDPGEPPPEPTPHVWPMFGYAAGHNHRSPFVGPQTGRLTWAFDLGATGVISSPAVAADGTIYVGSAVGTNTLFAVNPDGTQKWAFSTGWAVRSSPAIGADGTIYVGCDDNYFYAINPDGTQKWSFLTGNDVYSSPAVAADGSIYVGSLDKKVYAFSPGGTLQWAFLTGNWVRSSPAVGADGTIYVGSDDYKLYAINPDGTAKWEFTVGNKVISSPAINSTDGTIYVGSISGKLFAVDPDGNQLWMSTTGGPVYSSPGLAEDGTIYVGIMSPTSAHALLAFNPDGTQRWQSFTMQEGIYSSPTVGADGTIYVGSQDGRLYAVKPDGTAKWFYTCGGDVDASAAVGADGTVYISSYNKLFAFGPSV